MTTLEAELTTSDVAARVRPYVERFFVGGITLQLEESRIALRNHYWHIPVRPSHETKPNYPYIEALVELENALEDNEGFKVMIVPGSPLREQAEDCPPDCIALQQLTFEDNLTATEVAARVRPYVDKFVVGDVRLQMNEAGIVLSHNYWQIPVHPSQEPVQFLRYIEALADLGIEIQDNERIRVTLSDGDPVNFMDNMDNEKEAA